LNLATICSASSLGTFCLSMDGSFSTISFDCCVACGAVGGGKGRLVRGGHREGNE
jgi:hypothetical protein